MREQHTAIVGETKTPLQTKPKAKDKYGVVSVAMGAGISELFKSIGAKSVIEGGQTMNPSTEDIVKAVEEAHAEKVIILPNNKNIIMAANQAADVLGDNVMVVPAKTVPQGMAALLAFNPSLDITENQKVMTEALSHVKTGQITYAVRNTSIDGLSIEKGDFMGIDEGTIKVKNKDKAQAAKDLLSKMIDEDSEILPFYMVKMQLQKKWMSLSRFVRNI